MLKKFNKLYKTITEEIVPSEQPDDIKPTCSYCKDPVSIDDYLKQKKSYEEFTGLKNTFNQIIVHVKNVQKLWQKCILEKQN